ncbi:MAG: DUF4838 domain-containing protein [Candidatus Hydrogenedentes bacterium]|nr:DUF4838 domain-containing protein [Candidatus Hydrogenedentota bacterium]
MTRGVVLTTQDLATLDWPQRAKAANLTTIGTHITPREVAAFIQTERGQTFLAECARLGIAVEHELHAMSDLLPRDLFGKNPDMFRMTESGARTADFNCCVHSREAIEIICGKAVEYGQFLKPTTGRHFYWMDDGLPMCRCPECRTYSDSDQALILENAIVRALRAEDPAATLAHLAYDKTYAAPEQVKPEPGVFLEFAPIHRTMDQPIRVRDGKGLRGTYSNGELLDYLDANLGVFGVEGAQVLEYWLDVSLISQWKRPAQRLPWRPEIVRSDLDTYRERGIRHVTSFAAWIDSGYVSQFGEPPLADYGAALCE